MRKLLPIVLILLSLVSCQPSQIKIDWNANESATSAISTTPSEDSNKPKSKKIIKDSTVGKVRVTTKGPALDISGDDSSGLNLNLRTGKPGLKIGGGAILDISTGTLNFGF